MVNVSGKLSTVSTEELRDALSLEGVANAPKNLSNPDILRFILNLSRILVKKD